MNISFFDHLGGISHILVDVRCSDHVTDHQKLNVIQKQTFHFSMTFFSILVNVCCLDCLADHQKLKVIPQMNISFFNDLGGLFSHFG